MKTLIKSIIFLYCITTYSQSDINGIGRFKIGMDISIIDSLKNEGYGYKVFDKEKDKYYTGSEDFILYKMSLKDNVKKQNANKVLFELPKSNELSDFGTSPFIDSKKVFIVKYYQIAGIEIDYMKLEFYNGKLYEIEVDHDPELMLALKTKYKFEEKEEAGKKINCENAYRVVEYQETKLTDIFRKDESIYAYAAFNKSYYDCKEIDSEYTVVEDKKTAEEVFKIEHDVFMQKYNDPNRDELKSLKKL